MLRRVRIPRVRRVVALSLLVVLVAACGDRDVPPSSLTSPTATALPTTEASVRNVRVLVLGDSYAVGEGVAEDESWPAQLGRALEGLGFDATFDVVAGTGWTSRRVASEFSGADLAASYDLVVIGVGVNDHFNQYGTVQFEAALDTITERAVDLVGDSGDVLILSIVDWRATPRGKVYEGTWRDAPIEPYNDALALWAANGGHRFVDITDVSSRQEDDASLVSEDGLHASGELYALWVELMLPVLGAQLEAE